MKMKQIKKHAKRFCKQEDISVADRELICWFLDCLKRENKISKCGTPDDSGMLPLPPDLIHVDLD